MAITLGCLEDCVPADEVCDWVDNDCDFDIDELPTCCSPEICAPDDAAGEPADEDCDGQTDEGCPGGPG